MRVVTVGLVAVASLLIAAGVDAADEAATRFYVTGLLGESFATLSDPLHRELAGEWVNGSILTAGGAAGVAYARDNGQWRFEIEGRGRDDLTASLGQAVPPVFAADFAWAAADGWSATANVWRDWWIGERWAVYAGGGLGGGGYRYSFAGDIQFLDVEATFAGNDQVAELAWQAGGGLVYELSERIAFDVGYRFFSIGQADVSYTVNPPFGPPSTATAAQQFTASELLFGLRVYEPFRRWR
jgi:opacity protein-like surface antigen